MAKTFKPIFTITNRLTAGLTRIERARGFLEAATLSEAWVREMGRHALILEAHHTTHIEGTRLTFDQAERLWHGESVPEAGPDDARKRLNYRQAFDFVFDYLASSETIYSPPLAHDVPIRMAALMDFLSSETDTHPALVSGTQFQIEVSFYDRFATILAKPLRQDCCEA